MDGKMLARLALVVVLAVAITATAVHRAREDLSEATRPPPTPRSETPRADPLRERLKRCRDLGEAATRAADCLAAWRENRHRFLAPAEGR
ncbi:putative entry exclusion protein TrbK-alt [Mesorhizobium sp. L-8-10]|uniref:putative entry exclusion protein TrbK-alt n=1 Tax=Mesorhizobium sp. L-8-10 TaxID=2744523 RepID=UPI0019290CC8|nr:putative entry exclusion protein TrbK-alt [Mesorhizobium sp. L-8-10]